MGSLRNKLVLTMCWLLWTTVSGMMAQDQLESYHRGSMKSYLLRDKGFVFKCFEISPEHGVHTVYFSRNGGERFEEWERRSRNNVMCYLAVGFTQDWATDQPPLGLSLENGRPINRNLDPDMDGLVILDRNGIREVADLSAGGGFRFDLHSGRGRTAFLQEAQRRNYSCFQTQLMYSHSSGRLMGESKEGKRASRRFLAICRDRSGREHHLVMDLARARHLNESAEKALELLRAQGWEVRYLLNQDTGSRNIMVAFDDRGRPFYQAPIDREYATQLLIYFR